MQKLKAGCNVTKTDATPQSRMRRHKDGHTSHTHGRKTNNPTSRRRYGVTTPIFVAGLWRRLRVVTKFLTSRRLFPALWAPRVEYLSPLLIVTPFWQSQNWRIENCKDHQKDQDQDCEDLKNNEDGEHHENYVGMTRILKFVGMRRT